MNNAIKGSCGPERQSFIRFLAWLADQHNILFGRLHVHNSSCYEDGNGIPICGYAVGSFEPLCVPPESLASLFINRETISPSHQSVLLQLVVDGRATGPRVRKIPTEQDLIRALNAWQPHPELRSRESRCVPCACFCCDATRELSLNTPFMAAMHDVVEQLAAGEAEPLDALVSAFALGVFTAQLMQPRVQ